MRYGTPLHRFQMFAALSAAGEEIPGDRKYALLSWANYMQRAKGLHFPAACGGGLKLSWQRCSSHPELQPGRNFAVYAMHRHC
ncbi:MAG: hypothetical protein R3C11_09490 [Planctomycetaceae bacterium]